jgi:hypothetical protein
MRKLIFLAFALAAAPALAQQAGPSIDQTIRESAKSLAAAQTLILTIPELIAQRDQLQTQNKELRDELAKLKEPPLKPDK